MAKAETAGTRIAIAKDAVRAVTSSKKVDRQGTRKQQTKVFESTTFLRL